MSNKIACITGFTGQDGRYLSRLLLDKGYEVYGIVRRLSHPSLEFIEELKLQNVNLLIGDLNDIFSIQNIIAKIKPDEFYNLGAMSHVKTSFDQPEYTLNVTGLSVGKILESIRNFSPNTKFYNAGSSEQFGDQPAPQNEQTRFSPRSPYGAAKCLAHHLVKVYRESYGIFACQGLLFNHESPHRGKDFVTRKVTSWIASYIKEINSGKITKFLIPLKLGNLDAKRDWGFAGDFVAGMWMMLQQDVPQDYVLATGHSYSIREFCEIAFQYVGIPLKWEGSDLNEIGIDSQTGQTLIVIDSNLYRPAEVNYLLGDASQAKKFLGWEPTVYIDELVQMMIDYDLKTINDYSTTKTHY
jgi:GDPmannose 4,6-dehydratase